MSNGESAGSSVTLWRFVVKLIGGLLDKRHLSLDPKTTTQN